MSRYDQLSPDLRMAYRELALLLRRQPAADLMWREFWILTIPVLLPVVIILVILGKPLLSTLPLVILIAGIIWMFIPQRVLQHRGVLRRRS